MKNIYEKVTQHISVKFVIVMGIIFVIFYVLMNKTFMSYFRLQTNGNDYLENLMWYSPQKLYNLLADYGQHGRNFYIKSSLFLDFVFPLQYSMFFMSLAYVIYKNLSFKTIVLKVIFYLGIALCLFDWLENCALIIIISHYPQEISLLAYLATIMTLLKSSLTALFLTCSIIGIIGIIVKRIAKHISKTRS